MARKRPVIICTARQTPRRDPKFHQEEILEGAGRSTNALLIILNSGWDLRMLVISVFIVEIQR